MTFWKWSTTAANNGTADSTCPFPEGMSPSAVNDGARGMMAAAAKYRDDIGGMLVTAGTATAYTLFSNQGFDTFAAMHGAMICFTPHATNGANGTSLNVDGKGPKPILTAPGVGLPGAILVQGTPYAVTYNNTDGAFYLHGFYNDPFNVPFLGGMDHWDTVTPNSSFIFPLGQAISRTVYAAAFARWGTKFGVGDGATTFNVPNKAGKVSAMIEPAANLLTAGFFGGDSTQIGVVGGSEKHLLTAPQMPTHFHGAPISETAHTHPNLQFGVRGYSTSGSGQAYGAAPGVDGTVNVGIGGALTGIRVNSANGIDTTASAGGSLAHPNCQPTITCNYIIRIL
jgi:microcystin-dependent protein